MVHIVLFPSVLGVRPGIAEHVALLTARGHTVDVLDPFGGVVHDAYEPALAVVEQTGFVALLDRAVELAAGISGPLVAMGFSLGAGPAQRVAAEREDVVAAVLLSGALPPKEAGFGWRAGIATQVHQTLEDPWREDEELRGFLATAAEVGAPVEVFDYPGRGHLFADPSKSDEFQPAEAELMWARVTDFLDRLAQ